MENTEISQDVSRCEIWHKEFNLKKIHNLEELPREKSVFGVFALVNEEPTNCRYIGETKNLQQAVVDLFQTPDATGMVKFMQGPWVKMLVYQLTPSLSQDERHDILDSWRQKFNPNVDDNGEYPGYYE